MWKAFGAHLATHAAGAAALLVDPPLAPATSPGAIPPALLARVRGAIRGMDTTDDAIDRWFASFATQLAPGHELTPPARRPSEASVLTRLARGNRVTRSEEGRWAYLPRPRGALLLYVGGQELAVAAPQAELARTLCDARRFDGAALAAQVKTAAARALIVRLFSMGALRFGARASAR